MIRFTQHPNWFAFAPAAALSLLLLPAAPLSLCAQDHAYDHDHGPAPASLARALQPARSADTKPVKLPRLPKGVAELKFGEFFVKPIGPRGLEMTDKLRELDGKRVRVLGYMAQEETPVPGRFLVMAIPVQIHSHDNSLADDLPPAVLHVYPPKARDQRIPYAPGLMLLTGTLSVGSQDEADGRISITRLALDPPKRGAGWNTKGSVISSKGAEGLIQAGK